MDDPGLAKSPPGRRRQERRPRQASGYFPLGDQPMESAVPLPPRACRSRPATAGRVNARGAEARPVRDCLGTGDALMTPVRTGFLRFVIPAAPDAPSLAADPPAVRRRRDRADGAVPSAPSARPCSGRPPTGRRSQGPATGPCGPCAPRTRHRHSAGRRAIPRGSASSSSKP